MKEHNKRRKNVLDGFKERGNKKDEIWVRDKSKIKELKKLLNNKLK